MRSPAAFWSRATALAFGVATALPLGATPPEYATFGREQDADYVPAGPQALLRIWMVFVEQGDGILIQLPEKHSYDPDPGDGVAEKTERIDVLIDGGANPKSAAWRIEDFINKLYAGEAPVIEHVVISHHDEDHVAGLTALLEESEFRFERIFHNGLASYKGGARSFPEDKRPEEPAVFQFRSPRFVKGMAFVDEQGNLMPELLIDTIDELKESLTKDELHWVYDFLAQAVVFRHDNDGGLAFDRAFAGSGFIGEAEGESARGGLGPDLGFEVLWPQETLRQYGGRNWGETINGNSITFKLTYGDFEMIFTGDHNEHSEEELLAHLAETGNLKKLNCDVLKVPHHGSSHGLQEFFRHEELNPVLSVASMGGEGFQSKEMNPRGWEHPSDEVIRWLGGSHRVYHTYVQEKRFKWADIRTEEDRAALIEKKHVLVETDGRYFRVVEVPAESASLNQPPSVAETRRGNGTRWIKAK